MNQKPGKRIRSAIFCPVFLIFFPLISFGSFISLETTVSVSMDNGLATISYEVVNNGDEPAHEVEIEAVLPGKSLIPSTVAVLPAGSATAHELTVSPETAYSRMVVPLIIRYKDSNRYPFSAVSYAEAIFEDDASSGVFCSIEPLRMAGKGTLFLKIKSIDQKAHDISLRMVVPRELTAKNPIKTLSIPGDTVVYEKFEIENFSAIPPSTYTILGILSEERETGQYENAVLGKVDVVPEKHRFAFLSRPGLAWGIGGLLLVYIVFQVFYRIRNNQHQKSRNSKNQNPKNRSPKKG